MMYDNPRRRRADEHLLWKLADVLRHYAIFWIPLLWLLTSLGYGVVTPRLTAAQVQGNLIAGDAKLQAQIDTLKQEHATVSAQLAGIRESVASLVTLDCIDPKIPHQLKLIALSCPKQ